jgi:hypothetical protein
MATRRITRQTRRETNAANAVICQEFFTDNQKAEANVSES